MILANQTAVLTGASGGIGTAIAKSLASHGVQLILVARDSERLTQLQHSLDGDRHSTIAADLTNDSDRAQLKDLCSSVIGGIDLLINNAGCASFGLFESQTQDQIANTLSTNLLSPMLICHDILPLMKIPPASRIINIGSTFGSIGFPGNSSYCASKFGLRGFTEALRRELADSRVGVTYIAPRTTRTSLNSRQVVALNQELGNTMDTPEVVAEQIIKVLKNSTSRDQIIGWPEKFFVRVNALFPSLVDSSLRKQLAIIQRFAKSEP
ncbi:MAG: SDR family oxidoreductase [Lysobacterales bacterium]